jgi:hypothetical protein
MVHGYTAATYTLKLYYTAGGGGGGDTTPPTCSLTAPANGATVSGVVSVTANASDNVGVSRVEFYRGGSVYLGNDTTSPYGYSWDTTALANGAQTLTAKAFDAAGNQTTSATISVTVSNSAPPPPSGGQLIVNGGFESVAASWTASSSAIFNNSSSPVPARTGSYKAWLQGYGNSSTSDSLYQQIAIPSGAAGVTLKFWLRVRTSESTSATTAYDTLKVQIRGTSNQILSTLATYSNRDYNSSYVEKTFNLGTAYNGTSIRIYFIGQEDSSYATSFYVDDVTVTY